MEKTCTKCLLSKPVEEFYAHPTNRDRLFGVCRPCQNAKTLAHRAANLEATNERRRELRKENPERFKAQDKAERDATKADPERLANKQAVAHQWEVDNHDLRLLYDRENYLRITQNPKRLAQRRANAALWDKEHPEVGRRKAKTRRARVKGARIVDIIDLDVLYARDKGICSLCLKPVKRPVASIDHIIALAAGGEHSYRNVALAHRSCNSRKRDRAVTQQMRLF